jgi:hypothetical protein
MLRNVILRILTHASKCVLDGRIRLENMKGVSIKGMRGVHRTDLKCLLTRMDATLCCVSLKHFAQPRDFLPKYDVIISRLIQKT